MSESDHSPTGKPNMTTTISSAPLKSNLLQEGFFNAKMPNLAPSENSSVADDSVTPAVAQPGQEKDKGNEGNKINHEHVDEVGYGDDKMPELVPFGDEFAHPDALGADDGANHTSQVVQPPSQPAPPQAPPYHYIPYYIPFLADQAPATGDGANLESQGGHNHTPDQAASNTPPTQGFSVSSGLVNDLLNDPIPTWDLPGGYEPDIEVDIPITAETVAALPFIMGGHAHLVPTPDPLPPFIQNMLEQINDTINDHDHADGDDAPPPQASSNPWQTLSAIIGDAVGYNPTIDAGLRIIDTARLDLFVDSLKKVPLADIAVEDNRCPHCWLSFGVTCLDDPAYMPDLPENADEAAALQAFAEMAFDQNMPDNDPVLTPCGHMFGRGCLLESLEKCGMRCPMCRKEFAYKYHGRWSVSG